MSVKITNTIMHAVISVKTNIKWNGFRDDLFFPVRGILQEDPIFPYLFVLYVNKLSHLISHAVDREEMKGTKVGRDGSVVSHLMFADDMLLLGKLIQIK